MPRYNFGDIVVVERNCIGVVVKSWSAPNGEFAHDVYVRSHNSIYEYFEPDLRRYIYDKELSDEQRRYQE